MNALDPSFVQPRSCQENHMLMNVILLACKLLTTHTYTPQALQSQMKELAKLQVSNFLTPTQALGLAIGKPAEINPTPR